MFEKSPKTLNQHLFEEQTKNKFNKYRPQILFKKYSFKTPPEKGSK